MEDRSHLEQLSGENADCKARLKKLSEEHAQLKYVFLIIALDNYLFCSGHSTWTFPIRSRYFYSHSPMPWQQGRERPRVPMALPQAIIAKALSMAQTFRYFHCLPFLRPPFPPSRLHCFLLQQKGTKRRGRKGKFWKVQMRMELAMSQQ
jgi:hypothetical protein